MERKHGSRKDRKSGRNTISKHSDMQQTVNTLEKIEELDAELATTLFAKKEESVDGDDKIATLEQWKVCVQMAQNTSQRRATTNNIYITINVAAIGYIYSQYKDSLTLPIPIIWSLLGLIICMAWINSILYYRDLNKAKYNIIKELEKHIGVRPFICESYASPKSSSWGNELNIVKIFIVGYLVYGIYVTGYYMYKILVKYIKNYETIYTILRTAKQNYNGVAIFIMQIIGVVGMIFLCMKIKEILKSGSTKKE